MGVPERDRLRPAEGGDPAERAPGAGALLSDEDRAAIRALLRDADRPDRLRAFGRRPLLTLGAGLVVWGFAIYGAWALLT